MVCKIKVGDVYQIADLPGFWMVGRFATHAEGVASVNFQTVPLPHTLTDADGKQWLDVGNAPGGDGTWRVIKPVPADPLDVLRKVRNDWRERINTTPSTIEAVELINAIDTYLESVS